MSPTPTDDAEATRALPEGEARVEARVKGGECDECVNDADADDDEDDGAGHAAVLSARAQAASVQPQIASPHVAQRSAQMAAIC
ncbi:hypothetical protein [Sphingomonas melonis]|nr:hypothetical protein [Sphingomonas melonis]